MSTESLAHELADAVPDLLGEPSGLTWPGGYPDSLALCVIDSIQSIGIHYTNVTNVVARYREQRPSAGTDGAPELEQSFLDLSGVNGWVEAIGTRHPTSTTPGAPLKASVILEAARLLQDAEVSETATLRDLTDEELASLKSEWLRLPGQRSGISWRYLLMLSGTPGAKPDRMIHKFIADHTSAEPGQLTNADAAQVVETAAARLNISISALDHAMWRHASGR